MELKDVILSTLAEMGDIDEVIEVKNEDNIVEKIEPISSPAPIPISENTIEIETSLKEEIFEDTVFEISPPKQPILHDNNINLAYNEMAYLSSLRERLLVLFEGFQAPNNINIEAKIDMTLNFLEYTLSTIELRIEKLEEERKNESI